MTIRTTRALSRALPLALAGLLLASCSGEPSASDIEGAMTRAIEAQIKQAAGLAAGIGGSSEAASAMMEKMAVKISDFDKIGCTADGEKAYRCDVRYTVSGGPLNAAPRELAGTVRMVNTDDGWVAME